MRPLCRFSLLSVAVFRWTGSRWTACVLPLWIDAGSELLRDIPLAWTCGFGSFFTSVFGNEALRLLVNLERPSPRFRKVRLATALAPSWPCSGEETYCEFGYLLHSKINKFWQLQSLSSQSFLQCTNMEMLCCLQLHYHITISPCCAKLNECLIIKSFAFFRTLTFKLSSFEHCIWCYRTD